MARGHVNGSVGGSHKSASGGSTRKKTVDYTSDGVKDNDITKLPSSDWQLLGLLTFVAVVIRLFRIQQPDSVVFDEVHFGGFASKYIKGRFFMDVHPPLAKLLITLAGWLAGFNGDFDFKDIGKDYTEPGVPYVAMRLLPAILGVLTIPTIFLTLKATGCRTTTAALGAGLLIFENGLVTQSRLILLDSPLITFTAITALAFTSFTNIHEQGPRRAFTKPWWSWLAFTGVALGATVSVKWVGLFTIAWIGSLTLLQLWVLLADTKNVTPRLWFKHFFARAFCLIVIPVTFYMGMFAIHFICLVNPGDGDGFMSSEFQATLNSKGMQDVPVDVAFGSRISLRHHNTQGGYLHSHSHMYPGGSNQQQITLYPHKDENNVWLLENQTQPEGLDGPIKGHTAWDQLEPSLLVDGSVIKLYHITTDRRLHSHDVRAPVTEADWQNEVSAYGYEGFEGDANDLFRIEIIKSLSDGEEAKKNVRTIQTKFKLVHVMTGCSLFSHKVKLPDWGFEQQEVTCARQGTLPNSIWYIESNTHPMLKEDAEKVNYKNPGFWGKFWELQQVMWTTNAGLVESHAWDSRPPSWPILRRGINFWGKDHRQIYLIGNPVIWWSSTAAVAIYIAFKAIAVLRWQRSCNDYDRSVNFKRFDYEIGTSVLAWAFHYFPFYLMARQLFLHHYFPALYFAIIALCQVYDFVFARFGGTYGLKGRPVVGQAGAVAFLGLSIIIFTFYAPISYGNPWTKDQCNKVKLFETWDWDCNTFFDSYSQYSTWVPAQSSASIQAVDTNKDVPEKIVTPQAEMPILSVEERVEYRDENGRLLNEEEVKAMEGKVKFNTLHETKTRYVDAAGNEVPAPNAAAQNGKVESKDVNAEEDAARQKQQKGKEGGVAPPHPDVEGRNPETAENEKAKHSAQERPPTVEVKDDIGKEKSVEKGKSGKPRPASDANAATKKDEL